jgi:hypothetical protein
MMVLVRCFHPMRKVRSDDDVIWRFGNVYGFAPVSYVRDTESLSWTLMSLPTTPLFFLIE